MKADLVKALDERGGANGLKYGTAGFRADAVLLPAAMHRLGALAALRSRSTNGSAVGAMVTASHNPEQHNGAKLVDPDGSMLETAWENVAAVFVNAPSGNEALSALGELYQEQGKSVVIVARDTRKSSPELAGLVIQGVHDAGGEVIDLGVATTPQLHVAVRSRYRGEPATVEDYYSGLRTAFKTMTSSTPDGGIVVDCANGVGGIAMQEIIDLVPNTILVNAEPGADGAPLNKNCGADFVQKARTSPVVYTKTRDSVSNDVMWASLDGDADRLVCYMRDGDDNFILADGDRFAALAAQQVAYAVRAAELDGVKIGVGQTAYSNGAATDYLLELPGVEVVDSKTGVKHLEKAVSKFDVGIYWEPNGHGTVMYTDSFRKRLEDGGDGEDMEYLRCIGKLANQAVGDGVADLLLAVGIMGRKNMSFKDWMSIYEERMTANGVVRVKDRSVVKTENFDKAVVAPRALRSKVEKACGANVRAFVRPSGTEDVVRVFAEAEDQETADETALEIMRAVYDTCDGMGERP